MDDQPAAEPSVSPSTSPVPPPDMRPDSPNPSQPEPMCPLPRKPARFGRRSPPIHVTQLMRLAGGLGLAAALSAADAHTDSFGPDWEVPSERAGGETRRIANKRKAQEITRSAAEDFALLTSRTTSEHHAADFLSTVANVTYLIPQFILSQACLFASNYHMYSGHTTQRMFRTRHCGLLEALSRRQ